MPGRRGGLTTRGRCLLAAGFAAALCALLLDERDLLRIAAFVVVLPLLATLIVGRSQIGLRADRHLVPSRIPAGASSEVHVVVRSDGRIRSGVLIEDELAPGLGTRPRFMVQLPPRNGPVRLYYPLRIHQRGVYPVGPLRARATDPFGLAEHSRELAGHSHLVAIPVVVPLTGMPAGGGLDSGADGAGRQRRGQGEDSAVVRSYRHGDDLRRVHWRSTARRDELMVRVEERPFQGGATVLLDHRSAAHRGSGPTSSLEYAISLAASVCVHLHRHGQRVRLVTAEGRVLAVGTDPADHSADAVLDALAALRPSPHPELPGGSALGEGQDLVAVLGASEPSVVERLLRLRPGGLHSHAVLLDVAAWPEQDHAEQAHEEQDRAEQDRGEPDEPGPAAPDPAGPARMLLAAGWSVAVAQPQQPTSSVWEQLCLSSRNKQGAVR
ncbi:MAG: DUF58 domain-containing protein [Pseudonocardiaceae bacterium]